MKDERIEDLNPRSEDIEAKVNRMLDPAIPDEPVQPVVVPSEPTKPAVIQAVSALVEPNGQDLPSAPELPVEGAKKADTKLGKVVIPILHSDESEDKTAPEVKQIKITGQEGSANDVAEKLDEAIAALGTNETKNSPVEKAEPNVLSADATSKKPETSPTEPDIVANPETDKAVEEIVAAEGDELLEVEDAIRDTDEPVSDSQETTKKPHKIWQVIKKWWAKPALRWSAIAVLFASVIAVAVVPNSRYFMLNTAGVRASSSVVVLDQSTHQPLKNVTVAIGSVKSVTDEEGKVDLKKIKLGSHNLTIEKTAFAQVTKKIIVGWGSNPLGEFSLEPTGSQYSFVVTDYLSGKPLSKIEASIGEASAVSDEKGMIKLTIDKPDEAQFVVNVGADSYRSESVSLDPNDKSVHDVKLVPARRQVFVSKRTGKYDIYSVYIDGKDEKLVLAGSGNEKEGMVLVPHPKDNVVAYVSTRAGQHNSDGFLLSNLILINPEDNSTTPVATSERIQIIDWSGDNLVYVQIEAGSSANSPKRYRLMSYNYQDAKNLELASSNYFNDVISADGSIYYAPSSAYQTTKTGFYKINADGTNKQTVFDQEVWSIFRTSYDHLVLSVQQQWYDYQLGSKAPTKLNSAPANQASRVYILNPSTKNGVWIDDRDGKGTLLNHDIASNKDTTLHDQSGLAYPINWLNDNTMVYRVKTDQETADYAISIDGGNPVKIRDVTNSGGIDKWYYY